MALPLKIAEKHGRRTADPGRPHRTWSRSATFREYSRGASPSLELVLRNSLFDDQRRKMAELAAASRVILTLPDDSGDEGTRGYGFATLERAMFVLRTLYSFAELYGAL